MDKSRETTTGVEVELTMEEALADNKQTTSVPSVAPKYMGTPSDQRDMIVLGKKQVLRRNFRFVTMLGFGSTVICSWEVILPVFVFVLIDGGYGTLFWGFIAVAVGMLLVYASLAEMVSMCPTAGGKRVPTIIALRKKKRFPHIQNIPADLLPLCLPGQYHWV